MKIGLFFATGLLAASLSGVAPAQAIAPFEARAIPCDAWNTGELSAYNSDCKLVTKWINLGKAEFGYAKGYNYAKGVGPGRTSGFLAPTPPSIISNGFNKVMYP